MRPALWGASPTIKLRVPFRTFVALIFCSSFLSSCTPALSTLTPARITPEGHVQIKLALEGSVPVGEFRDSMEKLVSIKKLRNITPEQARTLAKSSSIFLVQPPGAHPYATLQYGINKRFEIGLRSSTEMIKGSARYQFMRVAPGIYGAVGLGLGTYFSGFPVEDYTTLAKTSSYVRNEMDMPIQFGISGKVGHLWLGPNFFFADYELKGEVCNYKDSSGCTSWGNMGTKGIVSYLGGHIGGAIGYQRIWFAVELLVIRPNIDADIQFDVRDIAERLALHDSGWVLVPSLGIIMWY